MAEGQVLIKDLPEATTVEDSSYIPVDNGTLTRKITVENFNNSSNQTAKGYAEQAQAAATTATEAIADVNSKVDAAQAQANIAATQAGYAQTYAGNAQTYAGNAQGYANTAQGSATNAAASASAASSSADAANDNATLARSWAEGNTGAREGENTNNARYWANKAQSAAQITIDDHLDPQSTNPVENKVIYNALNDMHTGGSNIEITTTQTSLYGKDVTISDGTTTVTETFDLTGKALFEGVLMTGDLTISSTDGTQTATGSINVPYFGNYSKSIAFWRATIDVTSTTTQFNGLTVSAKKNGVVMGSGTFDTDYGKNLCPATASTQTINGVTYTVNKDSDGNLLNVTVNGTATAIAIFVLSIKKYPKNKYILTGCPKGGNQSNSYTLQIRNLNNDTIISDEGNGGSHDLTGDRDYRAIIRIANGYTANNLVFYPMLRLASDPDDTYEPYHDPITSASITVPEAGTYTLEVTLDWKTYTSSSFSVTEETTYNETIDGFIAPISLTTPTSEFYGQSISVTRNGVALPVSLAFDNTGAASFTALDEGTYLFTLTYGGEAYTATVTVSAETSYSAVIKMWTATINISTTSSVLQLQQIVIKRSGVVVGTTQFSAAGTASYIAHETGTYTFECTYDSYPFSSDPVVVTDEITYSTTITAFTATLNITTTSTELYSQTITIKKGSTVVGTTAFSSSGGASYRVHEIGIYTAECTYSGDTYYSDAVPVSAETTYPMSIDIVTVITYNITATIYGAASDTLSYTDDNGQQTVTTDSTGKAENVNITITQPSEGVDPTIIFTSSVAKDPDNLSNDYSKSITITDGTSEIYVMPDKAIYWWGWKDNLENCTTANGWTVGSDITTSNPTYSTNNINFPAQGYHVLCGVGSKTSFNATSAHLIGKSKNGNTWALQIGASSTKATGNKLVQLNTTSIQYIHADITDGSYYASAFTMNNGSQNEYLYALWLE